MTINLLNVYLEYASKLFASSLFQAPSGKLLLLSIHCRLETSHFFCVHKVIPDLSEHYLVLDADVLLLRRTSFFLAVPNGHDAAAPFSSASRNTERRTHHDAPPNTRIVPILTTGTEYNRPFFTHAQWLLQGTGKSEGLGRYDGGGQRHHPMMSGIVHHMPLVFIVYL